MFGDDGLGEVVWVVVVVGGVVDGMVLLNFFNVDCCIIGRNQIIKKNGCVVYVCVGVFFPGNWILSASSLFFLSFPCPSRGG